MDRVTTVPDGGVRYLRLDALTGTLLHRAWLKSGRPDPLLDGDAWDGFGLTIAALAEAEGIAEVRASTLDVE